jgi:predicted transposase YbfD/YdcC
MSDKMTVPPLKKIIIGAFSARVAIAALLIASVLTQSANAVEDEWWFDIEVILFERNLEMVKLSEKFKQSRLEKPSSDILDLLTPYLKPDLSYLRAGLPYCRASKQLAVKIQYEQDFAFALPVLETNASSFAQTDEEQKQKSKILAVDADENFQNQVASTDIVANTIDSLLVTKTTDTENVNFYNSKHNLNNDEEQQANTAQTPETNLASHPIQVKFVEWQLPRDLLCSYAEQIDPSFDSIIALQNDGAGGHHTDLIKRVPDIIDGTEWQTKRGAFLLPSVTMYMSELYEKIKKQRGIIPILHVNWRQEVKFGRENAHTFRLFAGENFAEQFDASGLPLVDDTDNLFDSLNQPRDEYYMPEQELKGLTPEQKQTLLMSINGTVPEAVTEDLFARITAALSDDTPINIDQVEGLTEQQTTTTEPSILKELWRLDGGITVYLRNVGRIPYLHIDSNLDIRQPIYDQNKAQELEKLSTGFSGQSAIVVNQLQQPSFLQPNFLQPNFLQPNFLQSVNFNQLRRVISQQVHYFDHPLFGMIVRINRYRWPEIEQEQEQETDIINSKL